jgi:RNA polymerase sigma-70 factor (ECF subfamily)
MGRESSVESSSESVMVDRVRLMSRRIARRLTRDDIAEDIAQEVAFDYLRKIRDEHWRLERSLRALVRSMTERKIAYRARGDKHRQDAEQQFMAERCARTPEWMDPARDCEAREDMQIREQALKEFPATARIAFRMVHEGGATHDEVAKTLGVSRQLVTYHVGRIERRLSDRLVSMRTSSGTPPTMMQLSRPQRHTASG